MPAHPAIDVVRKRIGAPDAGSGDLEHGYTGDRLWDLWDLPVSLARYPG